MKMKDIMVMEPTMIVFEKKKNMTNGTEKNSPLNNR